MVGTSGVLKKRFILLGILLVVGLVGVGIALSGSPRGGAQASVEAAPPAVAVNVLTLAPQSIRLWSTFSGRMRAVDSAEIRPEIGGRIMDVRFKDGQTIKAGAVLLVIDPRPYEAALAKAEANLASARTNAEFAKMELERAHNLIKTQAIAQRLYDERVNSSHVADASILVAEAEVKQARIDLDHAYVKAPISGRVGRVELTVGNLVQSGASAPLLTTIVSNEGIYADFEVDEQTYMKSIRSQANTQVKEQQIPVELTVKGDDSHPYKGTIYSFDNKIDTASGTIRARAKFDNIDGALVPGMFVSVNVANGGGQSVLLVPDRAIGTDQNKKYVFVVGDDNKVIYREVSLDQQVDGQRIVTSGVKEGDRVIVDGVQHVRPDVTVQIKDASLESTKQQSPKSAN